MTIKTFVEKLVKAVSEGAYLRMPYADSLYSFSDSKGLLAYGHACGWLEDSDERFSENNLDRRTAARIIHQFLRICCGIPDLPEIPNARLLKDLYVCPSCANHIAQVYERGIMGAEEVTDGEKQVLIFNHLALVSETEVQEILRKVCAFLQDVR